jgi:hypothetical protein
MRRNRHKESDRAVRSQHNQGSHTQKTASLENHTLTDLGSNITALLVERGACTSLGGGR